MKIFSSLKAKLMLSVVMLVLLTAVAVLLPSYLNMKKELLNNVQREGQELGVAHAHFVNEWLASKLQLTATIPGIAKMTDPESVLRVVKDSGGFDSAYFSFSDNKNFWDKRPNLPPGWFGPKRPWYQLGESLGKPGVTDPYVDASTKKLVLSFVAPLVENGKTLGVGATDMFPDALAAGLLSLKLPYNGSALVTDKEGRLIVFADAAKFFKPVSEVYPALDKATLTQAAGSDTMLNFDTAEGGKMAIVRAIPATDWRFVLLFDRDEVLKPLNQLLLFALISVGVVVAVLIPLSTWLVSQLTKGITTIKRAMQEIAAGGADLTRRIDVSGQDEIAETATAFNKFQEQLRTMFIQVRDEADRLTNGVGEASRATEQLAEDSRILTDQGATNAATIEELTVSIGHIADRAEDVSRQVAETGSLSNESAAAIARVSDQIGQSAQAVRDLSRLMEEVSTKANDIGGITQVIKEIADQTNLLALNASIEAARAGETGRGFAVVADEVRKLAERTQSATTEISTMIDQMHQATKNATGSTTATQNNVETVANLSRTAAEGITEIEQKMHHSVTSVTEIANSTHEQKQAATLMAQNTEIVTNKLSEADAALQQMRQTLVQLDREATSIHDRFAQFKL